MKRSDLHSSNGSSSTRWPFALLSIGFVGLAFAVSTYHGSRSEARELLAGPLLEVSDSIPALLPLQEERSPSAYEVVAPLAESFDSKQAPQESEPQCAEAVCPPKPEPSKLESTDPSSGIEPIGQRVIEASSKARRATTVATAQASSRRATKAERPARVRVRGKKRRRSGAIQGAVVGVQIEAAVRSQPTADTPTRANPVHLEEFGDGQASSSQPSNREGLGGLRD